MEIYVCSDESGVFDVSHNDWFVFGGLIFLSKQDRNDAARKYIHAERCLTLPSVFDRTLELKASNLDNINKGKLFRSLNSIYRFGCVVNQHKVLGQILIQKKASNAILTMLIRLLSNGLFKN